MEKTNQNGNIDWEKKSEMMSQKHCKTEEDKKGAGKTGVPHCGSKNDDDKELDEKERTGKEEHTGTDKMHGP